MRRISNLFIYIFSVSQLLYRLFINARIFKKQVYEILDNASLEYDEAIDDKYKKRVFNYGILGTITNEWFATLRGSALTDKERTASFYLGTATAVYDDLFDLFDYTAEDSKQLSHGISKYGNVREALSKTFYDMILDNIEDEKPFLSYLRKVEYQQEISKQQMEKDLSVDEIRQITYDKGCYSVALFRSVLNHEYQGNEAEVVYDLGRLMQLTDDTFDVRVDDIEGVQTLLTVSKDVVPVYTEYQALLKKTLKGFKDLNYSGYRQFSMQVMFLMSTCLVCFDQLVRAQSRLDGVFEIKNMTRSELVCDMGKVKNQIRAFWCAVSWRF